MQMEALIFKVSILSIAAEYDRMGYRDHEM